MANSAIISNKVVYILIAERREFMTLNLRRAIPQDKPRILEIAAQIWEGEDYVPLVVDEWLRHKDSELTVVELEGQVVGFSRFVWLLPGYAWLEGLRTDPQYRNLGAAKAVARYFLEKAYAEGATEIGLSTYIENHASIHIIESHGFDRVGEFVFLCLEGDSSIRQYGADSNLVVDILFEEALDFIRDSEFLRDAQGYMPYGWKFYPFERAPEKILEKLDLSGIRREGKLSALLGTAKVLHPSEEFIISFLDGEADDVELLCRYALHQAKDHKSVIMMLPKQPGKSLPVFTLLKEWKFEAWNNYEPDVFVYRQRPERES